MSRIPALDAIAASPAKSPFDAIKTKLGSVPSPFRVMGHGPAALKSYLGFSAAIAGGALGAAADIADARNAKAP